MRTRSDSFSPSDPGVSIRSSLGERHLRKFVREYTEHYHAERNHQGRGNELIETPREEPKMDGAVECQERLGGVLNYYRRAA